MQSANEKDREYKTNQEKSLQWLKQNGFRQDWRSNSTWYKNEIWPVSTLWGNIDQDGNLHVCIDIYSSFSAGGGHNETLQMFEEMVAVAEKYVKK